MENAIAYTRSARSQQEGDTQLLRQEVEINLYCRQNNLKLLKIFSDNGATGSNLDRKGWKALKNHLKKYKGIIKYLIIADLNRISREAFAVMSEIRELDEKNSVVVRTVMEPLLGEGTDLIQRRENIITSMIRSERIKQGIRHAAMRKNNGKGKSL